MYTTHQPPESRFVRLRRAVGTWLPVVLSLIALGGFVRLVAAMLAKPDQIDFGAYYVAGRLLNAGLPLYHFESLDAGALGVAAVKYTEYVYPPFFAGLLRPIALLPYYQGECVWLVLNLLCYLGNCFLIARLLHMRSRITLLFVCCGLFLPAVYATIIIGQVCLLISLLLLGVLYALLRMKHPIWKEIIAGVLFGLAVAIKIYPAVFGLFLLAERRYWSLVVAVATIAASLGVGLMIGGEWRNTEDWFFKTLPSISSRSAFPPNQSLRGVTVRLFNETHVDLPVEDSNAVVPIALQPILPSSAMGAAMNIMLTGLILAATGWCLFRRGPGADDTEILQRASLVLTLMLLITPVAWDMYYVHLLLPLAFLVSQARFNQKLQSPLLLACLLIVFQSYWSYIIRLTPNPLFTIFGCLGVVLLWFIFTSKRHVVRPV